MPRHSGEETGPMEHTQSKRRLPAVLVAGTLSLMLVVTLVQRASEAAFTGQTENTGNTFGAATIDLTNNRETMELSRMFYEEKLVPNQTLTSCIEITYAGPARPGSPQSVKLYGNGTDNGLAASLDVVVDLYAAGQTCATATPARTNVYTGTLDAFRSRVDYATGAASWSPTDTDRTRAFGFTVTLRGGVGDQQQGKGATQTFTWEVQS
jgi:hypothetical protein